LNGGISVLEKMPNSEDMIALIGSSLVDTPDEVDKEYHRMVSKGATPIIEPKTYPWGLRSCYVADPEGNLIEIATWKNKS
jgi:uncharacterized glyoxalase superfamily protein PhnB